MPTISLKNIIDWLRGGRSLGALAMVESILDVLGWGAKLVLSGGEAMEAAGPSGCPADDEALAAALEAKMPCTVAASGPAVGAFPWAVLMPLLLELLGRFLPKP